MKGYNVYSKIQQFRSAGFSQRQVARRLGINRKTVKRYWEMPVNEYEEMNSAVCRVQYLDKYQSQIVGWLLEFPDMTASQVCDWLKEHYREEISERTVSRYVKQLREEYGLKKSNVPREYEAVPELPMGKQMQVDFGQKVMPNVDGGQTKVYVAAFVLSRSRYKYAQEQSRPFTSVDLVRICHDCFRYMGGMPEELVFDQDSIVCVSENAGDIIYTYEFEKFRQECGLSIRMCRGADPESKGKIENVVKYIKGNFLSHRMYTDDCILNGSCLEWLERTANAKVHGTTKLVPAEVFQEEREYLRPLPVCDQAKTSFLSSVSHDIRIPMNAIIGFLTLMQDEVEDPMAVRKYIRRIDDASKHLLSLINDVLDMSKIESGSTTLSLAEMDLAEVITEINTFIQPQTRAKNQTFEIYASHMKHEHLVADKMRLNQILINLLSNSVKYTPEGGSIEMRVEELPQVVNNYSRIRFTVRDNGLGMSEDYLKVIFEPFTRADTKATREIQGTGLGMPITKSLVDLMGGTINVESKLGEGSTFIVELELRIQERESNPRFWADHRIGRMLVVDDEEEVCRNIVKAMSGAGVSTDYAVKGEQAVQMARQAQEAGKPYDLILLDWKMPGMSGLDAARLIRKGSKAPILLLTSYDWREIEQDAVEIGVNHFMPKPFFMSTFKEAVHFMMDHTNESRHQESDVVRGMHILVVDDIEVNRIILVKILNTLGAECDTAANGRDAVEKFMGAPDRYDLILMDVQMPEMDGYEATRAIRASSHPSANSIPIIAMTANAFVDDVRDAINSGMDAHIAKPVQIDNLKTTIQQVLDNRTATENL